MNPNLLKPILGASALAFALAISTPAHGQLSSQLGILDLTANDGLNPATGEPWADGDTYHLIYVTTGTTDATSTDIADYNAFVQADAAAQTGAYANMGTVSWFALGSTATTNAIDNAVITGPVINIANQSTVATDAADLWDFLFPNAIQNLNEENKNIWTGTSPGGVVNASNELGAANGTTRRHWSAWTNWGPAFATEDNANQREMVAISQALTVSGPSSTFQLTIAPSAGTPGSFDLEWESQEGKLYNLHTSTDLTGGIPTWTLLEGDIEATPPTNSRTVAPDGARRFYAVEEFDAPPPPPVFATDFEADDGGFTVSTTEGSAWEWGTPDSDNGQTAPDDLVLTAGNSGNNAWGVTLGTADDGLYTNPTTTSLRSPVIDLSAATAATFTFAEAVDFGAADVAEVYVISDSDDSEVAGPIHTSSTGAIRTADWATANGGDPIVLPAAALGRSIRLEWRFAGKTDPFLGWYIDDVAVTAE